MLLRRPSVVIFYILNLFLAPPPSMLLLASHFMETGHTNTKF